jgi:DNA-binding SARP family transcriptional activator
MFGPFDVTDVDRHVLITDFHGVKTRQILAILSVHPGIPLSKKRIAELLWEQRLPSSWHSTLEGYVSLLRQALQPGVRPPESVVATRQGGYVLLPDAVVSDLTEFDALVNNAITLPPSRALEPLAAALALARGDVLADEPWSWTAEIRGRYRRRVLRTAVLAGQHALAVGDAELAVDMGQRACELDRLAEDAWSLLIRAHWHAGRRADALRCYNMLRTLLADELGIAPGHGTQRLHIAILRDEPAAIGS